MGDVRGSVRGTLSLPIPDPDDSDPGFSFDEFVTGKLGLRGTSEFEVPSELRDALSAGEVVASSGFAPPPYAAIKRSAYVHKQAREILPAEDQQLCTCASTIGFCDDRCPNRALQQECTPGFCSCGPEACRNRPFSQLASCGPNPLVVFKTEHKGWGVKALRSFHEGELLIEYVG